MNRWESIEAFVEVVRLDGFSAAARKLKVSSSHISRLVSNLEAQLGTQLLYRTTRQLNLTDVGRLYYEHCKHLIDGFNEAELEVTHFQAEPKGLLRISCSTIFGERYIAPLINDFVSRHPKLNVDMHFSNRNVDLVSEGFDLAIRLGVLEDSTLIARRLADRREYVCASPAYLARYPRPHTLAELQQHNCLVGSNDSWHFLIDGQRRALRVQGNWRANSGPAILDAVLKGLGIAQLPDYYVDPFLASGELIALLEDYQHQDAGVWAVYPKSRHLSPKVRQCVDFLAEAFRQPHWSKL
ncbi:LysR family transcriptional regulator [Balneatrix alpica]|uniref:LysR family transcriptional regulator n=1 Tax=Balneatrix alpica TaxID=75684 RepID=UPI0027399F5E|nr:LysR family transcriptional regulator [Balneatrix alpica]